jgi:hypothetical protein
MAQGYEGGEHPQVNDRVQAVVSGRMAKVTNVNLDAGNAPEHDQVSVTFEDGGVGISVALAKEFRLIKRG